MGWMRQARPLPSGTCGAGGSVRSWSKHTEEQSDDTCSQCMYVCMTLSLSVTQREGTQAPLGDGTHCPPTAVSTPPPYGPGSPREALWFHPETSDILLGSSWGDAPAT